MFAERKHSKRFKMGSAIVMILGVTVCTFLGLQAFAYADRPTRDVDAVPEASLKSVARGINNFAFRLYREIAEEKSGDNLFLSPVSIYLALGMTNLGSKGNTYQQMLDVLVLADMPNEDVHPALGHISAHLAPSDVTKYDLAIANKIYLHNDQNILDTFASDSERYYRTAAEKVDFAFRAEETRDSINGWVKSQTRGKIVDLIKPGIITDATRLVLVNAIYFKGNWTQTFDEKATQKQKFYSKPDDASDVDMMHQKAKFNYGHSKELQAQILELPYEGSDLKMVILLPDEKGGLSSLEEKISFDSIHHSLDEAMSKQQVLVSLPKFKLTRDFSLKDMLMRMGMTDVFSRGLADLSGIDGSRMLYLGHVIHKAFIEVNEQGSEAAAASAAIITSRSMTQTTTFTANHPFLFLIMDDRTGIILFMGRMSEPSSLDNGKDEL